MCLCIKDEEQYLDEFIDYHSALGFGTIYIYDNTERNDLRQWGQEKNLQEDVEAQIVIKHFPGEAVQGRAYLDCAEQAIQDNYTWAAFFDVDEFLILKKHTHIDQFLYEYCHKGAVSINWIVMGTADREIYSPQPLTKRFKYATKETVDLHLKTIIRLSHMDTQREPHAHYPYLKPGFERRMTNGAIAKTHQKSGGPKEEAPALLYHYTYRSYKEYLFKRLYRGRATVNSTDSSHKNLINQARSRGIPKGTFYDDTAWKAVKKYVPKYRYYEELFPDTPSLNIDTTPVSTKPQPQPHQKRPTHINTPVQIQPNNTTCAINFHGLARSFASMALPTIITNIVTPNLHHKCDYFVHFQNVHHEGKSRAGHGGVLDPDEVFQLEKAIRRLQGGDAVVAFSNSTEEDVLRKHADLIHKIKTTKDEDGFYIYQPFDPNDQLYNVNTTINIVKMWHNLESVWHLMEQYEQKLGKKYEQVAMMRLDSAYLTPVDIFKYNSADASIRISGNATAVIPGFARWPVNDRLVFGPRDFVKEWANRFDLLDYHMLNTRPKHQRIGIHSEHFLQKTVFPLLQQRGYNIVSDEEMCFLRTRAGNVVWATDCANDIGKTREWMNDMTQIQEKVQGLLKTECKQTKFMHKLQLQCYLAKNPKVGA